MEMFHVNTRVLFFLMVISSVIQVSVPAPSTFRDSSLEGLSSEDIISQDFRSETGGLSSEDINSRDIPSKTTSPKVVIKAFNTIPGKTASGRYLVTMETCVSYSQCQLNYVQQSRSHVMVYNQSNRTCWTYMDDVTGLYDVTEDDDSIIAHTGRGRASTGVKYFLQSGTATYSKAKIKCAEKGQVLAMPKSRAAQERLEKDLEFYLERDPSLSSKDVWIGLKNDSSTSGHNDFTWVDGSSLTWTNWKSGQPNIAQRPQGKETSSCGHLRFAHVPGAAPWYDGVCTRNKAYICEKTEDDVVQP